MMMNRRKCSASPKHDDVINVDDIDTVSPKPRRFKPPPFNLLEQEVIDVDLETSLLCPNVYEFTGSNQEFNKPCITEPRNFKGTIGKVFTSVQRNGYGEIDLFYLKNWYHDLRFAPMVTDEEDMDGNRWYFCLVMIYPGNPEKPNDVNGFIPFLSKFYRKLFSDTDATEKTIDMAIQRGLSMMVILIKCRSETIIRSCAKESKKSLRIIAATTFYHASPYKKPSQVDVHLSWLAVKHTGTLPSPPKPFQGWRRQGFGLFLLKCMIKYIYASKALTKDVSNDSGPCAQKLIEAPKRSMLSMRCNNL